MGTLIRRGISKRKAFPEESELNLVPFMDMLIALIPFLMISATFATMAVIETQAPSRQASSKSQVESSLVMVMVTSEGYVVTGSGPIMKSIAPKTLVPKTDGHYDQAALSQRLVLIKQNDKKMQNLLMVSEPNIPYSDLIDAMDAARTTTTGEALFPEVFFGGII